MLIEFKAHDHKGTQEACMHACDKKNPLSYSTEGRDFIGFLCQYTRLFYFSFIKRKKNKLNLFARKEKFNIKLYYVACRRQ